MQERQNGEIKMELKELIESFKGFSYAASNAGQALKTIVGRLRNQAFVRRENEIGVIDLDKSRDFDEFRDSLMNMKLEKLEYEDIAGRQDTKICYF